MLLNLKTNAKKFDGKYVNVYECFKNTTTLYYSIPSNTLLNILLCIYTI